MDRYTKKIQFLLTVVTDIHEGYPVTVSDIGDVVIMANMISERIIGKQLFDTNLGFDDVVKAVIHKLAKSGAIELQTLDEVKELEESGQIEMDRRYLDSDEFIFVEDPIWDKPSWITRDEAIAMELGTFAAYLGSEESTLDSTSFVRALTWAARVQKEVLKKQAKKIDK